jgi:hypothetical protein
MEAGGFANRRPGGRPGCRLGRCCVWASRKPNSRSLFRLHLPNRKVSSALVGWPSLLFERSVELQKFRGVVNQSVRRWRTLLLFEYSRKPHKFRGVVDESVRR